MYEEAAFRALLDRVPEEDKAKQVTVLVGATAVARMVFPRYKERRSLT